MIKASGKLFVGLTSLLYLTNCFAEAPAQKENSPHINGGEWATFSVCAKLETNKCNATERVALDDYDIAYTGEDDDMVTIYIRLFLSKKGEKKFIALTDKASAAERLVSLMSCDGRELFSWQIMDQVKDSDVLMIELTSTLEHVVGPVDMINCKAP